MIFYLAVSRTKKAIQTRQLSVIVRSIWVNKNKSFERRDINERRQHKKHFEVSWKEKKQSKQKNKSEILFPELLCECLQVKAFSCIGGFAMIWSCTCLNLNVLVHCKSQWLWLVPVGRDASSICLPYSSFPVAINSVWVSSASFWSCVDFIALIFPQHFQNLLFFSKCLDELFSVQDFCTPLWIIRW